MHTIQKLTQELFYKESENAIDKQYEKIYTEIGGIKVLDKRSIPRYKSYNHCSTDGIIQFTTDTGKVFYGIQEIKYSKTDDKRHWQALQALMYGYRIHNSILNYDIKVYIINSNFNFQYIFKEEIKEFEQDLWNNHFSHLSMCPSDIFKKTPNSLSKISTKIWRKDIPIHGGYINSASDIENAFINIFKYCGNNSSGTIRGKAYTY